MKKLEHHFRLQKIISSREKQLDEDFPPDLLRVWTDFKTPATIGKGGLKGEETAKQPHNLALVTVHGLMLQYKHLSKPEVKKAQHAFAVNLCEHATKTSYFTYQHILHALEQPEMKKIFNNPRFTRLEFTFDCASTYMSQEMVYNLTKGFAEHISPRKFTSIRFSPQCHCHGKSNLDRRFSSLTSWKKNWEDDDFHDTILSIDDLEACYVYGLDRSNQSRVTIDHKEPLVTEISKIELKPDPKEHRPYVDLPGLKSTNSITYITESQKLYNNVLPQVPADRGKDITSRIYDSTHGKPVTEKMKNPGKKRKKIVTEAEETSPKVVESQFVNRKRFISRGGLENYIKYELKIDI